MTRSEEVHQRLEAFKRERKVALKGQLAAVLQLTDRARSLQFPLDPLKMVTVRQGQVAGLSGAATQRILKRYGIMRMLAREGGRTSRGSIGLMQDYVRLLNAVSCGDLEVLDQAESYWVERIREYFNAKPLQIRYDASNSMRALVADVLAQAARRQRDGGGTMYVGAVLQHLIGAKLETVSPGRVKHMGASVADDPTSRGGDFVLGDVVLHVTTSPSEAVIQKCQANLQAGKRPILVTLSESVAGALVLARNAAISDRLDILEAEQFIAANIHEWSEFGVSDRKTTIAALADSYNDIVSKCETDPSLRLELL